YLSLLTVPLVLLPLPRLSRSTPFPYTTLFRSTGCVSVMIAIIAKEQNFTYANASFDASGTLDVRGLMGTADVTPNFQTVTLHVALETEETDERLRALEEAVESRCPVMTMLRDSGVRIDGAWTRA